MTEQTEMPKYKCHKEVHALKIKWIGQAQEDGSVNLTPEDEAYAMFAVDKEFAAKHDLHEGCYYVVYEDGYKSISPAEAFEGGYTLIDKDKPVINMVPYYGIQDGPLDGFYVEGHISASVVGLVMHQMPKRIRDECCFSLDARSIIQRAEEEELSIQIAYASTPKPVWKRMMWLEGENQDIKKYGGLFDKIADDVDLEQIYYDNCEEGDKHATAITCFSFDEDMIEELSR